MSDSAILTRITQIENELAEIKSILAKNLQSQSVIQLEGLLADISVSEEDISSAKRSLFRAE